MATEVLFQFQQNFLVTNDPVKRVKGYATHLCACVLKRLCCCTMWCILLVTYQNPYPVDHLAYPDGRHHFLPVGPQKLPPLVAGQGGLTGTLQ